MMNKKRLAALALSAVMATSTMSFPVYAADFSDGATAGTEVQVQSDFTSDAAGSANVEVQVAEPAEETVEAAGANQDGLKVDKNSVTFWYNSPGHEDFEVTYKLEGSNKVETAYADPAEAEYKAADCENPGKVRPVITILGEEFKSEKWFVIPDEPKLSNDGHHFDKIIDTETTEYPTHWLPGEGVHILECSICGATKTDTEHPVVIPAQEHTYGDPVYVPDPDYITKEGDFTNVETDEDGFVIMKDGHAVLKEADKDGHYEIRYYCTDSDCSAMEYGTPVANLKGYYKEYSVPELAKKAYKAVIISQSDEIVTGLVGKTFFYPTVSLPLVDEAEIELADCRVGGTYTVAYYTKDNRRISDEEITVAPHHYQTYYTAVFATANNANQCNVKDNKDGSLSVTNTSCYLPVEYTEVQHCSAEGCYGYKHVLKKGTVEEADADRKLCADRAFSHVIATETKTAAPAGKHVINTDAKDAIAAAVKKEGRYLTYADLLRAINNKGGYAKLSAAPDCEVGGTVTVSYICMVDKKEVVETQDIKVYPTHHKRAVPTREEKVDIVEPTCEANGSYDAVVKCEYCGKEIERREDVQIPRLPHTNEIDKGNEDQATEDTIYVDDIKTDKTAYLEFTGDKVVDLNGEAVKGTNDAVYELGETTDLVHYAGTYAKENVDGVFKDAFAVGVRVYTKCTVCGGHKVALESQNKVTLKIVDVKKESANGKAGSITLEATYKTSEGEKVTADYTVPYFSNIEAYNARLEEQPETPDEKLNGLHWDEDGECRYYVDGEFQKDFSGILEYEGKSFVLNNGVLCRTASGLNLIDDEWYYLTEGRIRTDVTQVVLYDDEWFYVTEGKLDTSVDDLVSYDGETFVYVDGRYAQEGNGLWIGEDGVWYFLSNGRVAKEHTGLAMYDNEWFYVVNGKLAVDYNGTVEYNGGTFKVAAGMVKGQVK